jgi:hypothetical protein
MLFKKKTVDRRYVKVKTEHGRHGHVLTSVDRCLPTDENVTLD